MVSNTSTAITNISAVKISTDTFNKEWNQTAVVIVLYTEQRWRRQLSSSSDESYRGIVIFRDLIAAVSASFWEKMLPSLQRKFQRCWMHACYDALEVRHIFASNMFQNTTSKNVIFYVTFPYGNNARNPSNNMFCSDQVYFCFKTLLLSLKLVLRYFQGCWQSILYVKKCKLI